MGLASRGRGRGVLRGAPPWTRSVPGSPRSGHRLPFVERADGAPGPPPPGAARRCSAMGSQPAVRRW